MNKKNKCPHEDDIFYRNLQDIDGVPYYTVECMSCGSLGIIELIEGENTFGLSKEEIRDIEQIPVI